MRCPICNKEINGNNIVCSDCAFISLMNQQLTDLSKLSEEDNAEPESLFDYSIDNTGVVIEAYLGDNCEIVVPETIERRSVYKIEHEAFYENKQLKSVVLPKTLTIIGANAFAESTVGTIELPESLDVIEDGAFSNTPLEYINLPSRLTHIGEQAFSETTLGKIHIPVSVVSIGKYAFSGTDIETVVIPNNIRIIPEGLFSECSKLHTVIIQGAEKIEKSAFEDCYDLKNIYLPNTLNKIEDAVFHNTAIEKIIIPEHVLYVGDENFPAGSHIAVLGNDTEVELYSDNDEYASVTIYCNQSNKKVRRSAKEFGMVRKPLSEFPYEDYEYQNFEVAQLSQIIESPKEYEYKLCGVSDTLVLVDNDVDSKTLKLCISTGNNSEDLSENIFIKVSYSSCANADELSTIHAANQKVKVHGYVYFNSQENVTYIVGRKVFILRSFEPKPYGEISYCKSHCVFYDKCLGNKSKCVKSVFEQVLSGITVRSESAIRLSFGIGCNPKNIEQISLILCIGDADRTEAIIQTAVRKLRHPERAKILRSTEVGLALFSAPETNYSKLWKRVFGETMAQDDLYGWFLEKQKVEEEERVRRLEFEKKKKEQQSRITTETTLKDCYFGEVDQDIPNEDTTIGELIKLTGQTFVAKFGNYLFEEVALVLATNNLYFADCDVSMRNDIQSYIRSICPKAVHPHALSITIDDLDFSVRTFNCLKRAGINRVGDIVVKTYDDMRRIRNLGRRSLEEVIAKLESLGLTLKSDDEV